MNLQFVIHNCNFREANPSMYNGINYCKSNYAQIINED